VYEFPAHGRNNARFLLPALGLFVVSSASAGEWAGRVEMIDGVEQVMNPAESIEPASTVALEELWRIGGDSDAQGELFGVINQIATDADGNVYLLDQQLCEVGVFSPQGEYLRTIGREGEGPGEFRSPQDLFFLSDGNLGVLQLAPGRIVMLTPEGDPAGDHPLPELEGGGVPTLVSGRSLGDNLLLVTSKNTQGDNKVDIHRSLIVVDANGVQQKELLKSTRPLEFINFEFDETMWITFDNRWQVAPGGDLYGVEFFLPYEIIQWDREGNKKRVIRRDYKHYSRTDKQKQEQHDIFDGFLQNQLPRYEIKISQYDPDITQLYPREDGSLWVLTSHGMRDRPDGSIGVFDVFDSEGRFVKQLTLMGEGDPIADGYYFLGERVYVVTDQLEANIASRGGRTNDDEADVDEAEPICVICYRLNGGA
jgi:hypothetical protein